MPGSRFSRPNHGNLRRFFKDGRITTILLFLPPALVLFTLFVIWPLINAGMYAGYRWSGFGTPENWVGLQNFELLARHGAFHTAFSNTVLVICTSIFVQIPLALGLALLVAEKTWSNTVFRLIFFFPFIMAEVATGLMWTFILDGDYGVTAKMSDVLGLEPIYPLADPGWAFFVILFVIVWKFFGFHMMIFIAALQGVQRELTEAAELDGAGPWRIAWHVKIPLIRPAIAVSVFFAVIGSLQLFDLIVALTNGGPSHTTHTLVSYLYTFGIQRLKIGFGSAVGIVLFVLCVFFAVTYQSKVLKRSHS